MRRHEKPRQPNTRVDLPVTGNWCDLSDDERRAHIMFQLRQVGTVGRQQIITCLCGKSVPIMFAYRCYECGAFWCPKCAAVHFDNSKRR